MRDLRNEVLKRRPEETQYRNTPEGDSKANGLAERAVQSVQKQARILKLALERNLGSKFDVQHACFPSLNFYFSFVIAYYVIV